MNEFDNINFIINKYNDKLCNYKHIDINNINNIPFGTHLKYVHKNGINRVKGGYFKQLYDGNILELYINRKRIWHIYLDNFYIFQKKTKNEVLRSTLQSLLDNDFNMNLNNNNNKNNNLDNYEKIHSNLF